MGLPQANLVLFFLSAFVGLWGVSVVFRGWRARRMPGTRRCPECREDMLTTAGRRCPACGFEAETEVELQRRQRDFRVVLVGVVAITAGVALVPAAWWVRGWETTGYGGRLGTHPLHAVFWGVVAFGLVLAAWSWRGDRSRGRRRCPRCWYDMRATLAGGDGRAAPGPLICPECGHEPGHERALYRPRRRLRAALLGLAIIALGLYGQTVPRALRTGPLGLVPTTVLIGAMEWLPKSWYIDPAGMSEATLESRVSNVEVGPGQLRWAVAAARRGVRHDPLHANHAAAALLLDNESPEVRAEVTLALTRSLGDPKQTLSAAEAKSLNDHLSQFIGLWEAPAHEERIRMIEHAIREHAEVLLRRAEHGSEDEASLCLKLIAIPREPLEGAMNAILVGIRQGTRDRVWTGAQELGERVAADLTLVPVLRELLLSESRQERNAGAAAVDAARDRGAEAALLPLILEMVFHGDNDQTSYDLAISLAVWYPDSEQARVSLSGRELPPAAAGGFAAVWSYDDSVDTAVAVPMCLPALRNVQPFYVAPFVDLCLDRAPMTADLAREVMTAAVATLRSEDPAIRAEAVRLLEGLVRADASLRGRVDALLAAASIDPADYLTPDLDEVRFDLPSE